MSNNIKAKQKRPEKRCCLLLHIPYKKQLLKKQQQIDVYGG